MDPKLLHTHLLALLCASLALNISAGADQSPNAPPLKVVVDGRVELLSLVFRVAGNSEYNQGRVPRYTSDAEKAFRRFADHEAVKLAGRLRNTKGVSYDAVMAMAVHLDGTADPQLRMELEPWPEGLDQRWTASSAKTFVSALRQFVKDSGFTEFLAEHRSFYAETEQRLIRLMEKEAHLEWFGDFFGARPAAKFTLIPGLLNGGACYGARFLPPQAARGAQRGMEELFCILGVWQTDAEGMPTFNSNMVSTVVHEFAHSYANPFVTRHGPELRTAGESLFRQVSDKMRSQAYGNGDTMLREYMVRACVIRYLSRYGGPEVVERAIEREEEKGFLWMRGLVDLLGEYEQSAKAGQVEGQSDAPRGLDSFAPKIVAYFKGVQDPGR